MFTECSLGVVVVWTQIPFATGLHKCLGIHLALMELRLYTALLLRDYEFKVDESKFSAEGIFNSKSMVGIPHYNVFVTMKKRHRPKNTVVEEE